ncbi:LuxR family transcriptional regulator [Anopheles sinensis]|uniref:LuxR family transcriptional regulator n=1 Tax=Anopheles sinensis TaxID=74873 RepID=A0A084WG04_ANOSI|nr:LuxR family transcriptional regulator [Anopheles sinensis]
MKNGELKTPDVCMQQIDDLILSAGHHFPRPTHGKSHRRGWAVWSFPSARPATERCRRPCRKRRSGLAVCRITQFRLVTPPALRYDNDDDDDDDGQFKMRSQKAEQRHPRESAVAAPNSVEPNREGAVIYVLF